MTSTTDLREAIRRTLAEADGFAYEGLEPHDYQRHADALLALLPPVSSSGRAALLHETADGVRAEMLRDFLWRLEQSAGDAAAEKFLDDNQDLDALRRVAAEEQCAHGPERHGPEAGCIECRCASATGHGEPVVGEQPDTQETP